MDKTITPIKKTRVSDEVFKQLYAMIRNGTYQTGDSLPNERVLSEQFQVSRASVREALRTLETMGMIESLVGVSGGNFVKKVDIETIISPFIDFIHSEQQTLLEIMEYRLVLETEIARIAAERRTDDDLIRIRKSLELMEQSVKEGGIGLLGDNTFHEEISRATHNQMFVHMLSVAKTLLSKTRETSLSLKGVPETGIKHHWAIFRAIEAGDPEKAANAMRNHLVVAQKNLSRI